MAKSIETGVKVYVQRDGIVNHSHDGVKGWHNPASKHGTWLHAKASVADNLDTLTEAQAIQYAEALAGKSFYDSYRVALQLRRDAGEVPVRTSKPAQDAASAFANFEPAKAESFGNFESAVA